MIKKDYINMQNKIIIELLQKMVKSFIPLDLKFFEKKILRLKDITDFESLESFIEKIIQNQIILSEAYNFHVYGAESTISLPLKLYYFFEQLKNFSIKFREFLFELKKLNI